MADYTYESIRKNYDSNEQLNKRLNESISENNELYKNSEKKIREAYNTQIKDSLDNYEDEYRENAVQSKINEFYVAEEMANMGLTDSGFNRSQITANKLLYSNQKAKISKQRQSMVDKLTSEMNSYIAENENSRLSREAELKNTDSQYRDSLAVNEYNSRITADAEKYAAEKEIEYIKEQNEAAKEAEEAAYIIKKEPNEAAYIIKTNKGALSYDYTGSLKSNGVSVYYTTDSKGNAITRYVDDNSGKVTEIASNTNPYTFTVNKDVAKGVFSNGYQPNNIDGKKLVDTGKTIEVIDKNEKSLGRKQKIFSITTGWGKRKITKYYTWNGAENVYSQIKEGEDKKWDVVQEKVGTVTKAKV